MQMLFWTLLGFFLGAIPFSLLIGKVALRTDIRAVGDGNPGATNVLRSGSKTWAALAMLLDMFKGALPVGLAHVIYGVEGWALVPVAIAPVLGHIFSPFLHGHGGKGVATTGGIWIGLTYGLATLAGTAGMSLGYLVQDVPFWAVAFGLACIGGYLVFAHADAALWVILVLNAALVLWRYRGDLGRSPQLRWRKKS
ncbi:MAG: glycerol-3-phosphate acyltransferase [Anaerolineae bacterium]|nr:glycerol-3-phosphate acyltransferase [Anaerolineae bacterium]